MVSDCETSSLILRVLSSTAAVGGYTGFVGILLVGYIIDAFGRKTTLLLALVPHIIGWSLLYSDYAGFTAILGRSFTGLTTVSMFYPPQLYAVECITVNHERLRSIFRAWPGIANSLGFLLTFFAGTFITYQNVAALAALLSVIIFVLIFIEIPESPTWLYMKGRYGDAELSERKLGITQPILKTPTDSSNLPATRIFLLSGSSWRQEAKKLTRPDVYTPVIVMTIVCALIFQTGGTVMTAYMLEIIGINPSNVSNSKNLAHTYSIVSGFLILIAHISVSLALPYLGCRKMSLSMSFFMCIGMLILGITTVGNSQTDSYGLHVFAVWLVTFSFHFGVISVPVAVMSDLFPVDAKGFASIPILTMSLGGAFAAQLYPYLKLFFAGSAYYAYAFGCIIYAAFIFFFMPETVGRTYEEVKNSLLRSRSQ